MPVLARTAAVMAALAATTGVQAADLGGNCCADLEERIAELEASTARKGNRKVSLTVSGQISQSVMFWDDTVERNVYVATPEVDPSRFRFTGTGKISPDLSAGYILEIAVRGNRSDILNQDTSSAGKGVDVRHSAWWLRSEAFGTAKVGLTSTATSELILIDLGEKGVAGSPDYPKMFGGLLARNMNGSLSGAPGNTTSDGVGVVPISWSLLTLGNQDSWDTDRRSVVAYSSPVFAGFNVQAAWGQEKFWDVALRYAGVFNEFKLAAGIGYRQEGFSPCAQWGQCNERLAGWLGSASLIHVPSGLFVSGAAGTRERWGEDDKAWWYTNWTNNRHPEADFWYLSGGVSRKFVGMGKSAFWGEYGEQNDGLRFQYSDVTGSQVTHWGLGATQYIDAAAMELYVAYKHFDGEFNRNLGTAASPHMGHVEFRDFQVVMTGMKLSF